MNQSTTLIASQTTKHSRPIIHQNSSSSSDRDDPLYVDPPCMNKYNSSPTDETYNRKSSPSFVEFFPTKKRKRKTTRMIRPAMNSRGIELEKVLSKPKKGPSKKRKTVVDQQAKEQTATTRQEKEKHRSWKLVLESLSGGRSQGHATLRNMQELLSWKVCWPHCCQRRYFYLS